MQYSFVSFNTGASAVDLRRESWSCPPHDRILPSSSRDGRSISEADGLQNSTGRAGLKSTSTLFILFTGFSKTDSLMFSQASDLVCELATH